MSSFSAFYSAKWSNLNALLRALSPNITAVFDFEGDKRGTVHFKLVEIWESFDELSACGVGAPVKLSNGDFITQYFVPSLSAMQIFFKKPPATPRNTNVGKDQKELKVETSTGSSNNKKVSSKNSTKLYLDHPLSRKTGNDHLYLEFYELAPPYLRIPFIDKIIDLAGTYPKLMTLDSNDISPASWIAIAWHPIYHIPCKGIIKELATTFLSFHTLSPSFQDASVDNGIGNLFSRELPREMLGRKRAGKISLVPFGLVTYRLQGNIWNSRTSGDDEKLKDLESAAESWLKQLKVRNNHQDFNYFIQHSPK